MSEVTVEDTAAIVAEYFNQLADKPLEYEAAVPGEIGSANAKADTWKLFCIPFAEREEAIDRGDMCREEHVVRMIINGPIEGNTTRNTGLQLAKFLRFSLRETEMGGFRWDSNEVQSPYDSDVLKTKNQFLSAFDATFYRFA
jgi:hypothetical protein